jgi:hypothetical protein
MKETIDFKITMQEFDDYININHRNKLYRVHYSVKPHNGNQPCTACSTTQNTITWRLVAIGVIYSTDGYFLVNHDHKSYDKIVQTAAEQIRQAACYTTCDEHIPGWTTDLCL